MNRYTPAYRSGSPPRMRGKGSRQLHSPAAVRITPARAGKSSLRWAAIQTHGDHPRVCGEKKLDTVHLCLTSGSPPRMRGKAPSRYAVFPQHGITPACAGKRQHRQRHTRQCRDHPRVCGEKLSGFCRILTRLGSPPRVRGKELPVAVDSDISRITPACAGKRRLRIVGHIKPEDHPRVCGEKDRTIAVQNQPQGSPPRVRGKELPVAVDSDISRITPAYAGKSMAHLHPACVGGDYPRVCREKRFLYLRRTTTEGSPPRVRGKVPSSI